MKLKSVSVGGFKNLERTTLELSRVTAIISPNNYGKSNLIEAIDFGVEFLSATPKERKGMMAWIRGIPINRAVANDEFFFEIEFEDDQLGDYRYVKYGYTFSWYRDDGNGQKITNEWIEARATESVRYSSFLKRQEEKYRKEKSTVGFRKITLDPYRLAIDTLIAIEDIELHPVIEAIKKIDYHICSSLDLRDRFQPEPIEYVDSMESGGIAFDDKDVPRAVFQLQQQYPKKYALFCEAVFHLFPEFTDISVQSYELKADIRGINMVVAGANDEGQLSVKRNEPIPEGEIPFRIRDELYRILITNKYLNQPINMAMMSTGTKRVFWLLANVFIANARGLTFIGVEELETSIHPRLLRGLLEILDEGTENTSLLISSHSPFLVQYLKPEKIYVGIPNDTGTAKFRRPKASRTKALVAAARDHDMAVGEYLFELMTGDRDSEQTLSFFMED